MSFRHLFLRAFLPALLAPLLLAPGAAISFDERQGHAVIESGEVAGESESGIRAFMGIPYAAPPVGDLRWRAPRPPHRLAGVFEATEFGPACPQAPSKDVPAEAMSEDCLTLNIWSPAKAPGERLPVMVWIHGGGFNKGSARMPIYNGENLAQKGVVIVTFNYRLGYLGFFGHPQLTEEARAEGEPTANYALLDQLAALQWVKRNIEAFGGDPSNVTLFGESAGGVSTLALMTSPMARGLFHKVIIQSGGGRWIAPTLTAPAGKYLAAHDYGIKAAKAFGFKPEDAIAALRRVEWREIRDTLGAIPALADQTPFIDGKLLVDQIEPVFSRGDQTRVPMIVGANSYEGVLLRGAFHVSTDEVLRAVAPQLDDLSDMYPPQLLMTPEFLADHIWGDANFVEPARMIARTASRGGQPVYHYGFDFQPPLLRLIGGTPHGLEVAYAFGNIRRIVPFPLAQLMHPHNYEVSRLMGIYWTNFAKTGDPNGGGALEWPRFTEGAEETLVFNNEGLLIERDYLKDRLDLFRVVAPAH
ncbi:MAG: carboxylesterase family protein [Rhodomicrobium sp.]|jgi:para-nitrobenzyl esterase